eukprot:Phypoly_transcript_09205.p1 GENE.Phypoly_transcript_09205~~Phypoly_transcript_09205.p1  ORF type:complete len:472 (+),score=83.85 Phypoly_transcript_09205:124-1416(+)
MATKEIRDSPAWLMYCRQKRLSIEGTDWWQMVQRISHVPHHVLDPYVYLLADYEDEATLHAKNKRWNKIFAKWSVYSTKKRSQIRAAIVQGVPMSARATFWKMCLELHDFPPVDFLELATSGEYREDVSRYLDIDYPRICHSDSKPAYRNVLRALSAYDKDVLYTPALGVLATMLLNYLDEEDAFRALATLMHGKYGLKGLFVEGLPKLHAESRVFKFLFETQFPKLYPRCSMVIDHIIAIPMLGIFTSLHPNIGMDKIWDMVMFDGYDLILCVLLALLDIHEEKFQTGNEEQIFTSFIRLGTVEDMHINNINKDTTNITPNNPSTKNPPNQIPNNSTANNNNTSNKNTRNNFNNEANANSTNINVSNTKNNKSKESKKRIGEEVVSVGDVLKMDKLLDLAFKYHKKLAPKIQQYKRLIAMESSLGIQFV